MRRFIPFMIALGLVALLPLVSPSDFYINLASQAAIAALMALGLNILVGYAGLTSLGHAAFPGIAAYLVAWLSTRGGLGPGPAAVLAVAGTFLVAGLFGLLALRATGLGFVMITMALCQIVWGGAYRWTSLTGGDNGLSGVPRPFGDMLTPTTFLWLCLIVLAVAIIQIGRFAESPLGVALRGTRDQPRRMSALGYDVWRIRFVAWLVAASWGAVAGLLYAWYHQFVSPHMLAVTASAEVLLMVVAGGAGTLAGPLLGAALVVLLKNLASIWIDRWVMLLGATFVFIVLIMPDGLAPGLMHLRERFRKRMASPTIAPPLAGQERIDG
ncbi:branched-chain amino acid ABC transporter permease [Microvirga arabica]|uniref:branched-chain amino acid ABC transporter permease n=1 Tax=Microvirga arabica TaxID=1128671 RepID=UPI00193ABB81|nr:branched-chain amino acid ABC transporter permease [Microvirga arabica]MBM1174664.1 branched-chain amino acid ABC transporter permease [Microvirga arabica]